MELLMTRIDLSAIAHNTRVVKRAAQGSQLMAAVKADAYNHGAAICARVMASNGADQFGVATLAEAHALRAAGITQPVLSWIWRPEQDVVAALADNIDLAVTSPAHARAVIAAAQYSAATARVSVKVDTGLCRSGVDEQDWAAVFRMLANSSHITVTGVFSHLACGDEPEHPMNDEQAQKLRAAIATARAAGLNPTVNHLSNSPSAMARPDLRFDMIRPGLVLYGLDPIQGRDDGLRPAMTWTSRVAVVKRIHRGDAVSYGATWVAPRDGYTAIITVGYADGLPRRAQDKLQVAIGGHRYPQIGRVCMDQIVVDLGDNPHGIVAGAEALLFGPGTHGEMTPAELGEALGTSNYEVICMPHGRTRRMYVGGDT